MKRSKLEEYLTIVSVLIVQGPLERAKLGLLSGVAEDKVEEDVSFLVRQNIIEKINQSVFPTFIASPLGIRLVKYFGSGPRKRVV